MIISLQGRLLQWSKWSWRGLCPLICVHVSQWAERRVDAGLKNILRRPDWTGLQRYFNGRLTWFHVIFYNDPDLFAAVWGFAAEWVWLVWARTGHHFKMRIRCVRLASLNIFLYFLITRVDPTRGTWRVHVAGDDGNGRTARMWPASWARVVNVDCGGPRI